MKGSKTTTTALCLATALVMCSCGKPKECATCIEIAKLQEQYDKLSIEMVEGESAEYEGSIEFEEKERKFKHLKNKLNELKDHECSAPLISVKNNEYNWGGNIGNYTGQWKGSCPNGKGDFEYNSELNDGYFKVIYSGDWKNGQPNGNGEMRTIEAHDGRRTINKVWSGEFTDSQLNGIGYYSRDYAEITYVIPAGEFSFGNLVGTAVYEEYDLNGDLYDWGVAEGTDQKILWSARKEWEKSVNQKVISKFPEMFDNIFNKTKNSHGLKYFADAADALYDEEEMLKDIISEEHYKYYVEYRKKKN